MRDGWVETKLGLVCEFVMGQAPLGERCNKEGIGTPFVKAGEFGESRPKIVEWTTDPLKIAKSSDVLVCVVGATAGKINLGADCAIGRSVAAIRPGERLHQLYLYYLLSLELSNLRSGSRGSAQGVITRDDLQRIVVVVPPLLEQKRIVDLISSVDSYIEALKQQLQSAKRSRNAVLHELLTAGGDDWVETSLGEIAEVIGGGTPSTTIGEYWDGDIVWLTPTEITSQDGKVVSDSIRKITELGFKNSGAQMLPKDSVILTSRASVGFVALAGKELCTNQGFQSLIPKPSVLSKFLMFWIQLNRPEFESRSAGSTFKEISKSNVKSIKLKLPPVPEQERIVEIINTIDEVIAKSARAVDEAKQLRSGLLSELLSGEHEIPSSYDKVMGAA